MTRKLMPHQIEGQNKILSQQTTLLAFEAGTGKTGAALSAAEKLLEQDPKTLIIYVCPPALKTNVEAESKNWTTLKPDILVPKKLDKYQLHKNTLHIIPDSIFSSVDKANMFNNMVRESTLFSSCLIIVDESHRFKGHKTHRRENLVRVIKHARDKFGDKFKLVYLTGTPSVQSGADYSLYNDTDLLLNKKLKYMNTHQFLNEFTYPKQSDFGGMMYTGLRNGDILKPALRSTCMLPKLRLDVLKDLPERIERVTYIEVLAKNKKYLDELESEFFDEASKFLIGDGPMPPLNKTARYRAELAAHKSDAVIDYIQTLLEDDNEKLVVFAHHRVLIDAIASKFRCKKIDGGTPMQDRLSIVDRFNNNPDNRVLVLSIGAASVGFNIQSAHHVLMAEASWSAADNDQAISRCHRLGQKNSVLAEYLCIKDTFDEKVLQIAQSKQHNHDFMMASDDTPKVEEPKKEEPKPKEPYDDIPFFKYTDSYDDRFKIRISGGDKAYDHRDLLKKAGFFWNGESWTRSIPKQFAYDNAQHLLVLKMLLFGEFRSYENTYMANHIKSELERYGQYLLGE